MLWLQALPLSMFLLNSPIPLFLKVTVWFISMEYVSVKRDKGSQVSHGIMGSGHMGTSPEQTNTTEKINFS